MQERRGRLDRPEAAEDPAGGRTGQDAQGLQEEDPYPAPLHRSGRSGWDPPGRTPKHGYFRDLYQETAGNRRFPDFENSRMADNRPSEASFGVVEGLSKGPWEGRTARRNPTQDAPETPGGPRHARMAPGR